MRTDLAMNLEDARRILAYATGKGGTLNPMEGRRLADCIQVAVQCSKGREAEKQALLDDIKKHKRPFAIKSINGSHSSRKWHAVTLEAEGLIALEQRGADWFASCIDAEQQSHSVVPDTTLLRDVESIASAVGMIMRDVSDMKADIAAMRKAWGC